MSNGCITKSRSSCVKPNRLRFLIPFVECVAVSLGFPHLIFDVNLETMNSWWKPVIRHSSGARKLLPLRSSQILTTTARIHSKYSQALPQQFTHYLTLSNINFLRSHCLTLWKNWTKNSHGPSFFKIGAISRFKLVYFFLSQLWAISDPFFSWSIYQQCFSQTIRKSISFFSLPLQTLFLIDFEHLWGKLTG